MRDGRMRTTDVVEAAVVVRAPAERRGSAADVTFVGAGDIADCSPPGAQATARLLDSIPGEVFTLGDNVYPSGTPSSSPPAITPPGAAISAARSPLPGNHDWGELNARRTSTTSVPPPARGSATTASTSGRGTSWRSTATRPPGPCRRSSAGWLRTWRPIRHDARWRCGITPGSARGRTATRPRWSRSGGCWRRTASIWC